MLRRLVVAYDFSEQADDAMSWAADLARPLGATLSLVHVTDAEPDDPGVVAVRKELARLGDEMGPEVATHVVFDRDIARGIVHHAEEIAADAIVVASRRLGALQRFFVGSVADEVLRRAHCPVIMVREGDESHAGG